jgi:Cd2+/Zn2+-exporting ATPase
MDCADEVAVLKREIGPLVGSANERMVFDILRGKMVVLPGAPALTEKQVVAAVARTGMRAEPWVDVQPGAAQADFWQRRGRTVMTAVSGALTAGGFLYHAASAGLLAAFGSEGAGPAAETPPVSAALYAAAVLTGGWFVVGRAWRALKRLRPDMNLLMTIAVIGAAVIGQWFEAAVVSFLFAVALALESWSVGRARRAVEALLAIAPDSARVLNIDGTVTDTRAADVAVGALLLVKPGDRIPLDGSVRTGMSTVNQAPITGESMPVERRRARTSLPGRSTAKARCTSK